MIGGKRAKRERGHYRDRGDVAVNCATLLHALTIRDGDATVQERVCLYELARLQPHGNLAHESTAFLERWSIRPDDLLHVMRDAARLLHRLHEMSSYCDSTSD